MALTSTPRSATDRLATDLTELRRDIDDAAVASVEHLTDERARAQKGAAEVRVDDAVPVIDRHVFDQRLGEDSGIVDEDVDPSESSERRVRHRPHTFLVTHIRLDEQSRATVCPDAGEDLGGMYFFHFVRDDEVGALTCERDRDPLA
jgi:hypothetical protein